MPGRASCGLQTIEAEVGLSVRGFPSCTPGPWAQLDYAAQGALISTSCIYTYVMRIKYCFGYI